MDYPLTHDLGTMAGGRSCVVASHDAPSSLWKPQHSMRAIAHATHIPWSSLGTGPDLHSNSNGDEREICG